MWILALNVRALGSSIGCPRSSVTALQRKRQAQVNLRLSGVDSLPLPLPLPLLLPLLLPPPLRVFCECLCRSSRLCRLLIARRHQVASDRCVKSGPKRGQTLKILPASPSVQSLRTLSSTHFCPSDSLQDGFLPQEEELQSEDSMKTVQEA